MTQIESELEWFIYQLWTKVGSSPTKFSFNIPETIFYRNNMPYNWYFTSKEGHVLKKNKINVTMKNIHLKFSKRLQIQDQLAATSYLYRREGQQLVIYLDYIPVGDFRTYMFYLEGTNRGHCLQKFTLSKQGKNTFIKCLWSQSISMIEKISNVNNFYEQKIPLEERVTTFEGPEHLARSENVVSTSLTEEISNAVKQIEGHLRINCNIVLLSGQFYFKQDKNDELVLVFVNNLKIDKPDRFTNESIQPQIKLCVRSKSQLGNDSLPAVIAPYSKKNSRPQSNYQVRNPGNIKNQQCPYCDQIMDNMDLFEFTFNQLLKMYYFYEDNHHLLLENCDSQGKLYFNKKLLAKIHESKDQIPFPFSKLFPNISVQKFNSKKSDPLFLYETMKLCEICFKYLKSLIEVMNQEENQSQKESNQEKISRLSSMVQPFSQNILQNHPYKQIKNRTGVPRARTNPLNSDIMFSQQTTQQMHNITQAKSINSNQSVDQVLGGFSKVVKGQEMNIITVGDSQSCQIRLESEQSEQSSIKGGGKAGGFMFSKVEAGRETESNIFNYPKSLSNSNFEDPQIKESSAEQFKKKLVQPQFGFVKVQNPQPAPPRQNQPRQTSNKALLPKLNWEKEYKQHVKEKTKKIKNDIFQMLDKIEAGKSFIQSEQDSLDLKILSGAQEEPSRGNSNFQNSLSNVPIHHKDKFEEYQEKPQQKETNVKKLKTVYRQQSSNLRIRGGIPAPQQKPKQQQEQKAKHLKKKILSAEKTIQRVDNGLNEIEGHFKENVMIHQKIGNIVQSKSNRIRPLSSKPENQRFNNNNLVGSSKSSHKHLLISNRNQSFERQSMKEEKKKPSLQIEPEYKPKTRGLLDFENMNDTDIKQIAQNADQLIEIIQNIKNQVQPPEQQQTSQEKQQYQLSPGFNNVADSPCIEDEKEQDISSFAQDPSANRKQSSSDNGTWW